MNYSKLVILLWCITFSVEELCTVNGSTGACMSTSKCRQHSGTSHRGFCRGGNDIQCCTNAKCNSGKGNCVPQERCKGTILKNMCPGPNNFKCCMGTTPTPPSPPTPPTPHTGDGSKIVQAARKMIGKYPYSWGGGDYNGATHGTKQNEKPFCNDKNVIGFDCSGLALYAVYQGVGVKLPHKASLQYERASNQGKLVSSSQMKPGDLVFYKSKTIHHVAIYSGNGKMIEAEGHNKDCSGIYMHETSLRTGGLMGKVARFW